MTYRYCVSESRSELRRPAGTRARSAPTGPCDRYVGFRPSSVRNTKSDHEPMMFVLETVLAVSARLLGNARPDHGRARFLAPIASVSCIRWKFAHRGYHFLSCHDSMLAANHRVIGLGEDVRFARIEFAFDSLNNEITHGCFHISFQRLYGEKTGYVVRKD